MKIGHNGHCRVLSISGGGVKGLAPTKVLQQFVHESGKSIHELFDFIVGTSIGGILATALTVKNENNTAKYTPEDMVDMMVNEAQNIFPHTIVNTNMLYNIAFPKYTREGIDDLLEAKLGNATFRDTTIPILTVSYSLDKDGPRVWSTFKAQDDLHNYYLKDAAGATSAAPIYFPPKNTTAPSGEVYHDVDGGIFANSPTLIGIHALKQAEQNAQIEGSGCEKIIVVSLGTGRFKDKPIPSSIDNNFGMYSWFTTHDLIGKMMKGVELTDAIVSQNLFKVIRINPELDARFYDMDNSDLSHMQDFNKTMAMNLKENIGLAKVISQTLNCLVSYDTTSNACKEALDTSERNLPVEFKYKFSDKMLKRFIDDNEINPDDSFFSQKEILVTGDNVELEVEL